MSEAHVEEMLAPYAEGLLSDVEMRAVEQHLAGCGACREAAALVQRGMKGAQQLPASAVMSEPAARVMKEQLLTTFDAPGAGAKVTPPRWMIAPALAAALAASVALYLSTRPPDEVHLRSIQRELNLFERTAVEIHAQHVAGTLAFHEGSSTIQGARWYARETAGLDLSLAEERPPEDGDRYRLEGASRVPVGPTTAIVVGYRIEGQPVTLLTADAAQSPDPTGDWSRSHGGKNVMYLDTENAKLLSWTNRGQTYVLVSELPAFGQQGCLLCHTTQERRRLIRGMQPEI